MKTTKGKLRNITTGIMHTEIKDVYLFFEEYTGEKGIMTHHLSSAIKAITDILKTKLSDKWFTKEWIKEELDEVIEIPDITEEEKASFWKLFQEYNSEVWNTIKDKSIIVNM